MKFPLQFYHHGYDWQIRDAQLKTILKVNIEGLDFVKQKETEDFLNSVVSMMNERKSPVPFGVFPESTETIPINEKIKPVKTRNPWGRAGRPR